MFAKSLLRFLIMMSVKAILLAMALFIVLRLPGRSVLNYYGYSVEISTGALVGGIIICFILAHQILMLWKWIKSLPKDIKKQWEERQKRKSKDFILEAFNLIAAGDPQQALQVLEKAQELDKDDIFNPIFRAQAAFQQNNDKQAEQQFTALTHLEETRFIGYRGLAVLKNRQGKLEEAHYFLQQALRERPDSPWVLGQLFNWNVEHLSFNGAETILEQLRIGGHLSKAETKRKKAVLLWVKAEHHLEKNEFDIFYESVVEALKLAPNLTYATLVLTKYYEESNRHSKGWKCLKKGYTVQPHPEYLDTFKELYAHKNPLERYQLAEELVASQKTHWVSYWLLAKLALEARMWGQTRLHLAALGKAQPDQLYYELMAEVEKLEHPHHTDNIQALYVQAAHAPRPVTWECQNCHTQLAKWQAFCPSCHAFDQITWGTVGHPPAAVNTPLLLSKK